MYKRRTCPVVFLNTEGKAKIELAFFRRQRVKKWPIEGDIPFSPLSFFDGEKTSGQNAVVKEKRKKYCVNDETDKVFSDTFFL